MELSFKYMLSVIFSMIIAFFMINFLGLFLNISIQKIELERIIYSIETSTNYSETAERLNDRNNVFINEFDVGDKKQYYVELTSDYKLMGKELKHFKVKGYTKILGI